MWVKLRKGIAWNHLHDGTFDTDVCEGHTSTTTGNVSTVQIVSTIRNRGGCVGPPSATRKSRTVPVKSHVTRVILRHKRVAISSDHGIFVVSRITGHIETVVVSFVLDCEVVILGPVRLPAIPNTLYPEGVRLPGQYVEYIIVSQPVITGRVSKSSDIIGPSPVTVKIILKTYTQQNL